MDLSLQAAGFAISLTGLALSTTVGLYTWIASGQRVHRDQLDEARAREDDRHGILERRLADVERTQAQQGERLAHVPSADDLHVVATELAGTRAEFRAVREAMVAHSLRMDRHEEFYMKALGDAGRGGQRRGSGA